MRVAHCCAAAPVEHALYQAMDHENIPREGKAMVLDPGLGEQPKEACRHRAEQADCNALFWNAHPVEGCKLKVVRMELIHTWTGPSRCREPIYFGAKCGDAGATKPGADGDRLEVERVRCPA